MKFKKAFKKGKKYLLKIVLDNGDEKWATTTEKVYTYAKKNFKEDEEVGYDYTEKNGQYTVKKILKDGESSKETETKSEAEPEFTCEECGKVLKDDKYEKCYTCNQKSRKSGGYSKSPEDKEQIKRLSILGSVSRMIIVLQGHVDDADTLGEIVDSLYDRFYEKLSG